MATASMLQSTHGHGCAGSMCKQDRLAGACVRFFRHLLRCANFRVRLPAQSMLSVWQAGLCNQCLLNLHLYASFGAWLVSQHGHACSARIVKCPVRCLAALCPQARTQIRTDCGTNLDQWKSITLALTWSVQWRLCMQVCR
jgi:hypothetical protein